MSINGFGNEWFQTDGRQNVYTDLANTSRPSNQEFLLPPSQPPVSMTSQPHPEFPFGWNSMVQAHPTPYGHQNHGLPSQPESNTSWNAYAYQQYHHRHQNMMTSQYENRENPGNPSSSITSDLALEMGPEEQPNKEYQNLMTSQNPELARQRMNNYPVHPPQHFTNPNIPANSMTSFSTWGQSGTDPTFGMAPKDKNWSMNEKHEMVRDVIDHPGHEFLENERVMTSQPKDEFPENPNPSRPDLKPPPKRLTIVQKKYLEAAFQKTPYPSKQEKMEMAEHLQLTLANVVIFFKNRRAKSRRWQ